MPKFKTTKMINLKIKKSIRKRAKSILGTYMNDYHIKNKVNPMTFYFRAVKYIMKYGI